MKEHKLIEKLWRYDIHIYLSKHKQLDKPDFAREFKFSGVDNNNKDIAMEISEISGFREVYHVTYASLDKAIIKDNCLTIKVINLITDEEQDATFFVYSMQPHNL